MLPEIPVNSNDFPSSAHITSSSLLVPTIRAWRFFLEDQAVSPHTVKAFTSDMFLLSIYLPADRAIGSITTVDLQNFLEWLQKGRGVPCSPKTLARRITSIKAFFRWLTQFGAVLINPSEKIPQRTVISPLATVLTEEEIEAVYQVAQKYRSAEKADARPYTLLALLLETGIKKGECLALTLNHLDFASTEGAEIFIRYTNPQNRFKERKIDLSQSWIEAYQEYCTQYELTDRLFPWSPRRLEYLLEDIGNEAGLEKHLSFDMCRWTCAVTDWRTGMDHTKIRQKMGVSKIQWREISMKLEQLA